MALDGSRLAGTDHRQGRSAEEIADELEATVEEVNSWITKGAEREAARNRSRFEPECSGCHQIIEINTVAVSYMGRVYHEQCARKAMFGPYAA